MLARISTLIFSLSLISFSAVGSTTEYANFYDIPVKLLDGTKLDLKQYKKKVVLIVNIASKCGFKGQLEGLQNLYKKYNKKGLEIIAFPSNDFMGQEPLSNDDIGKFCLKNYGVTFKIAQKTSVKGSKRHALYGFLAKKGASSVKWNFYKYLIKSNGQYHQSFNSFAKPEGGSLEKEIKALLGS